MPGAAKLLLPSRSKPPPFAEQAKDLKALRDSVVDAATVSAGLWLSYVFTLLYLFVAVAGVTHRALFFEEAIKLPFLNVDLPLVSFFTAGPILFLIVHAYVLLHFVLFADKVGVFHSELQTQISDEGVRSQLRRQLPSNIFIQTLAGVRDVRRGVTGSMLRLIAQISLVAAPIALLVLFQIQFLPYHPKPVLALWLRMAVLIDLTLLFLLWPSVARGKITSTTWYLTQARVLPSAFGRYLKSVWRCNWVMPDNDPIRYNWRVLQRVRRRGLIVVAVMASMMPLILVFVISTFPDEWLAIQFRSVPILNSLHDRLFEGEPDAAGRTGGWFSNRIILPDQILVDTDKLDKIDVSRSFQRRDLRQAVLNRADLRKADFTGALLTGATFLGAKLQNAHIGCPPSGTESKGDKCAQLQGTHFDRAQLESVDFHGAQLQGSSFRLARLQGADFTEAQLQVANFESALLQGSRFFSAELQGAAFHGAELQAADFYLAELQAADFNGAKMQGASFSHAKVQGALFTGVNLHGGTLASAKISRVGISGQIDLVDFDDCDPDTMPWAGSDDAGFTAWQNQVLSKVPPGDMRVEASNRLLTLKNRENSITELCKIGRLMPPQRKLLTTFLVKLACSRNSPPHVARGLLRSGRIVAADDTIIAGALQKGISDSRSCPGVTGFLSSDWEKLDSIVSAH